MNAKDIITWVESQVVDISNEQNIINFVSDLQNKIGELNFNLPDGTKAIGYAGSTNSIEGTGIYKTIDIFTQNSNGEYGFINNVADNILNYKYKDSVGIEHSLWDAMEQTVGIDNTRVIFGGSNGPCEKISVNSTTVIKNDIASGLKNSRSIFLQDTINTVICQVSSTVSLLKWSVAEWKQTDCAGSAQPVGVHDLQLAKNSAPVSQRHRPLLCNLVSCQIQSL